MGEKNVNLSLCFISRILPLAVAQRHFVLNELWWWWLLLLLTVFKPCWSPYNPTQKPFVASSGPEGLQPAVLLELVDASL